MPPTQPAGNLTSVREWIVRNQISLGWGIIPSFAPLVTPISGKNHRTTAKKSPHQIELISLLGCYAARGGKGGGRERGLRLLITGRLTTRRRDGTGDEEVGGGVGLWSRDGQARRLEGQYVEHAPEAGATATAIAIAATASSGRG
jgi:hypothetical protein